MKRFVFSLFFAVALILGLFVVNLTFSQEEGSKEGISAQSTTCHTTLTSGSGANYMQVCITNHDNLINFISPNGSGDHINAEGYALCDNVNNDNVFTDGYDAGFAEAGCGASTIVQPNGANTLPLTITRTCNCFKFKQVFSRDTTEKDITITMTLTNVCGKTLVDTRLARYFDGNINGDSGDDIYDGTADSVSGRDTNGVLLTALTFATSHVPTVEEFFDWNPTGGGSQNAS